MSEYETIFIIDPGCDDSQVDRLVETAREIISSGEGTVLETQIWGRRKLAYEIKKKRDGVYAFVRFKGNAAVLQELNRRFKLNELILRHLIVVSEEGEAGGRPDLSRPGEGASFERDETFGS
ncbi:MAG: 30S ribosomal protein S6 [Candidatus Eisenbacteria bacterium]